MLDLARWRGAGAVLLLGSLRGIGISQYVVNYRGLPVRVTGLGRGFRCKERRRRFHAQLDLTCYEGCLRSDELVPCDPDFPLQPPHAVDAVPAAVFRIVDLLADRVVVADFVLVAVVDRVADLVRDVGGYPQYLAPLIVRIV